MLKRCIVKGQQIELAPTLLTTVLVPSEVEASYTAIIDSILATSDLNTVSEKRIRKGLEAAVQDDLTPQKVWLVNITNAAHLLTIYLTQNLIKELIMTRFDKFHAETSAPPSSPGGSPPHSSRNGQVAQDDSSSDVVQRKKTSPLAAGQNGKQGETAPSVGYESLSKPPKKKRKVAATDDDARLAAMLQAEENSRSRPTRGAAARKVPSIKKRKGSSKNKSRAEQDSSAESESGEKKKRASNKNGAFHVGL